jgi:serine/threonine protein kinase
MNERRRYRILAPIARGSFGTVYRAELIGQGGFTKLVALKVLNPGLTENEEFTRRLRDEARLLALIRHRAIVGVDGLIELAGRWTVVMEYIEGADLKLMLTLGPVPPVAALEVTAEIAAALHVAWTRKGPEGRPLHVLHRDIKPSNIRITAAGEVKILDFGVARADFGSRESETRNLHFGSAAYMSPERIDFIDGPEGDVYAVGSMLFEMLAGEPLGKTSPDPKRHAKRLNNALARLWASTQGRGASVLGPLLSASLAYEASERPRARDLERRCLELARKAPGMGLRDWAEVGVPRALQEGPEERRPGGHDLSGKVIEETIDTRREKGPPAAPPKVVGAAPAQKKHRKPEVDTATRPTSPPPLQEDSGDEDTDQGLDSGWGARAHMNLPQLSEPIAVPDPAPSKLGDLATKVRIAPPSGRFDPVPAAEDPMLIGEFEEPSDRLEAIEFLTKTFEKPPDQRVTADVMSVPRGRDAKPLSPAGRKAPRDEGNGWIIGSGILAAIGYLVFFYMPANPFGVSPDPLPEARPGDMPGQAWNPENQVLRGQESQTPAPKAAAPSGPSFQVTSPAAVTAPAVVGSGTVRVTGFAVQVVFVGGGKRLSAGEIPPGTYRVEAAFTEGEFIRTGKIVVRDGSYQTIHCSKVYKTCRVE